MYVGSSCSIEILKSVEKISRPRDAWANSVTAQMSSVLWGIDEFVYPIGCRCKSIVPELFTRVTDVCPLTGFA